MITTAELALTSHWLGYFRSVWDGSPPLRLHTRALDDAGNPQMHPDFLHWLDGTPGRREGTEDRARLKRAMKRIHERSLREYEVIYRVMVLGQTVSEVADWLTDRSIRSGHPERYGDHEARVIAYAAIDKLQQWF